MAESKQPRFDESSGGMGWFNSIYPMMKKAYMDVPFYGRDNRARDRWLRKVWPLEPHLSGVLGSVVAIDKNRGWSLTGGRTTTRNYEAVLRNAENGEGWRRYFSKSALSFYTSNLGLVSETVRDMVPGRLQGLYHVDSARCRLMGGSNEELRYYPPRGNMQTWYATEAVEDGNGNLILTPADYFRVTPLPSTDEDYNGLGHCATDRALGLTQLMLAILDYDNEKLGAAMPQGLLILQNITETQWEDAMRGRKAKMEGREQEWFGGVATLAGGGIEQIDAKLVALSQLPDNFDRYQFIEFLMYGYALIFGYDAGEFWPKMRGGLGHSVEVSVQHQKATGKGGLDFILEYQTQLQQQLPDTIHFEFDQRDEQGDLMAAEVGQAQADLIKSLYESGLKEGQSLISREEARQLLARQGLIDEDWTAEEEEVEMTDRGESRLKHYRSVAREMPSVLRAVEVMPHEPIVRREYQPSSDTAREIVLWQRGDEMLRTAVWRGADVVKRAMLFEEGDVVITDEDVDAAIEAARERVGDDYADLLEAGEWEG